MATAFEAYKEYLALKNHFSKPDYDYFKYNGKVRVNANSFELRNDKIFFQKLAKRGDIRGFLVANLSKNNKSWIRELAYGTEAEEVYKSWLKRQQSLTYTIGQDLSRLDSDFNLNFACKNNRHPILLKKYLAGEITLETLCILLKLTGAKKQWDVKMEYDPIWSEVKISVEKYTPFIACDEGKIKKLILDRFSD